MIRVKVRAIAVNHEGVEVEADLWLPVVHRYENPETGRFTAVVDVEGSYQAHVTFTPPPGFKPWL